MKKIFVSVCAVAWSSLVLVAQTAPPRVPLANLDARTSAAPLLVAPETAAAAAESLRRAVPGLMVEFDRVSGAPKMISSTEGFLTGPDGKGATIAAKNLAGFSAADSNRVTKAFLQEHRALFGHGSEALPAARIRRDDVTAHNGLHTVVWEQQVDGIAVFEATLISHTTRKSELVSISSGFISNPDAAATHGTPGRASLVNTPTVSAQQAVALAAHEAGEKVETEAVATAGPVASAAERRQKFLAPGLKGEATAKLIWLPMDKDSLRLCWDVEWTGAQRGEMFRSLVDARTGEVLVRRCLTSYISDASYRVWTSDSPSPFSPGWPTPSSAQPSVVARTLVTLPAMDTNASPSGWIPDGGNETLGNNVDAHADRNNDNLADLPRPQGSPARVFDLAIDPTTQDPTNFTAAATVQLFYLCNWYHDKLYALGFTEAAGNFQSNNFARGGFGNDAVQADAQDGGGTDNANFSTPSDGSAGRMQMYIFSGPSPRRDGDLDAEIVFHEATHGLSWRLVGGGQALGTTQSDGMGEGWADFYAVALLSEGGDDVNGNFVMGGYATRQFGGLTENYYYGIRRYPYSTDMLKNPLTFKDIDPAQASTHAGIPRSPIIGSTANEVHNEGEVWCVTLNEARVNLINKYGWAVGNQLMLQLTTDGMKLTVAQPNFLQARDGIIQADLVDTGGANRSELWAAFAKRGMGVTATSPVSTTTTGLHEAFDIPDDLHILPLTGFVSSGGAGGPFSVTSANYTLTNFGVASFNWSLANTSTWLNATPTSGTLAAGAATTVNFSLNNVASNLVAGFYTNTVQFTNTTSGFAQGLTFTLTVLGAPVITAHPTNQTVTAGGAANFSAGVIGLPVLAYQWWFGGTNLPNATNLALTLSGVTTNQAGNYSLFVSNNLGSVTSAVAVLAILVPPPNDVCGGAVVISGNAFTTNQSTITATSSGDPVPSCAPLGKGVWYAYTPATNGTLVVDTFGTGFDTVLAIYTGSCGALVQVGCDDDSGGSLSSRITLNVTGGTTYSILAGGYSSATGSLPLHLNFTPVGGLPNDTCGTAVVISGNAYTNIQSTTSATSTGDPVPTCVSSFGKGVWYVFTPSGTGTLIVDTIGSGFDTGLGIYTGSCGVLAQVGCDDDGGGGLTSKITLTASNGVSYFILAGGYGAASGSLTLHLNFTLAQTLPVIVTPPTNQVVSVGGTANFNVTASGTAPLSFSWRGNGVVLPTGTNSTLTIANAGYADVGGYQVIITNSLGGATSSVVTLSVTGLPFAFVTANGLPGFTNQQFRLLLTGPVGSNVVIEAGTNLSTWIPLQTNPLGGGVLNFNDTMATNYPGRLYRALLLP